MQITIGKNECSQRLDKFLRKHLVNAPLSLIYRLIRTKKILVNDKESNHSYKLKLNDILTLNIPQEQYNELSKKELKIKNIKITFKILYEDEDFLIVDKPANIPSHGGEDIEFSLVDQILKYLNYKPSLSFIPALANRLDKETSGIIIVGKNAESLRKINELVQKNQIKKFYLGLVYGRLPKKEGLIETYLKREKLHSQVKVKVSEKSEDAKLAKTKYKVLKELGLYSLVEFQILTGRTHQIRAHLTHINHPIIGDKMYGIKSINKLFSEKYKLNRQFLHAYKIQFEHPIKKKDLIITSDIPKDLDNVLKKLQNENA